MPGHAVEDLLLAGEGDGGRAGDSRAAGKIGDHMLRQLGTGAYQAHMPGQHIEQLGQLVELPAAQKKADQSEALIAGGGDRIMYFVLGNEHGSEFENGEGAALMPHSLLQEEGRPGGGEPHCQRDRQQKREQQRQYGQYTGTIEEALDARLRPGT